MQKILKHQKGILDTLKILNLKSLNDIIFNDVALKALALEIGQVGEMANRLSESTVEVLCFTEPQRAYSIRNRIYHSYFDVKLEEIAIVSLQLSSTQAIEELKERIKYCVRNEKKFSIQEKMNEKKKEINSSDIKKKNNRIQDNFR